ncbi:prephenate dehydratase [Marinibaculum pumilum]|uniref:prephenate dehydratase n=1 Tax=Marinibaculum pumilum TaxID=1766165 RepID=A0ABV7L658_9PROT
MNASIADPKTRAAAAPGTPETRIAFQGMPGAYSHLACREKFPALDAYPCATFEDAFAAVKEGHANLGMIPIENSLAGRVADIHHLLPDSHLYVVGEHFHRVRHQLLAPKGATLEGVKRVLSHEQALSQCRGMTRDLGLEAVPRADTAGAAREVAERGDPAEAAIASTLAAEIYGLEVLRSHIEDRLGNTTRFIVMARNRADPDPRSEVRALTSIIFQVRSVPAALYKALGGFATNGINVVKLESYMTDSFFTVAQFYAEIEGHVADPAVERAFDELKYFSTVFRVLGCYPASDYRGGH